MIAEVIVFVCGVICWGWCYYLNFIFVIISAVIVVIVVVIVVVVVVDVYTAAN